MPEDSKIGNTDDSKRGRVDPSTSGRPSKHTTGKSVSGGQSRSADEPDTEVRPIGRRGKR